MDDNDAEITTRGPQARGELWCKGANVMKGRVVIHQLVSSPLMLKQVLEKSHGDGGDLDLRWLVKDGGHCIRR